MKVVSGNHYLAFVLSEACKAKILAAFPPEHEVVKCDHVTFAYPVTELDVEHLQALVNSRPEINTDTLLRAEGIEVFRVYVNLYNKRKDGKRYHLTHSRTADMESSDSNKVFDGEITVKAVSSATFKLEGEYKLIPIE